jgi:predicted aspartyl protease
MTDTTTNDHGPGVAAAPSGGFDRRGFLRRAGLTAAAGAVLPLLGAAGSASAIAADSPSGDPDQLFKAGDFAAAERGYLRLLHKDSGNAHAASQLGYIALLSNRFRSAETYLTEALRLAPGDIPTKQRLADCFVRQDMLARAVPLLPEAVAAQMAAVTGTPYEVRGPQVNSAPFVGLDPVPHIEASVNGVRGVFVLDTGAGAVALSTEMATAAGLRAVSSSTFSINGWPTTIQQGVAPSLRIGQLEVRNVPVGWTDRVAVDLPNGLVASGTIGTQLFYHFLTTIDYKRRALVLRQRTAAQQRALRAEAARAGTRPQPLWLASDHLPCTEGKINDYGPGKAVIDSGATTGLNISVANAQRAGIAIDFDHPEPVNGGADMVYPVTADRMSIGDAVNRSVNGAAGSMPWEGMTRFDLLANFTHQFFKPFAVTYDFVDMRLYVG